MIALTFSHFGGISIMPVILAILGKTEEKLGDPSPALNEKFIEHITQTLTIYYEFRIE